VTDVAITPCPVWLIGPRGRIAGAMTDSGRDLRRHHRADGTAVERRDPGIGAQERLTGVAVELVRGEPEQAIARFVESHGVDMVVMGTVARTGIAGLVMGNTAERVLQRLRSSALFVKLPGFASALVQTR
jgi:nucleotide-binding universal stress UspA family protein